jgi:hypothetical protein
VIAGIGSLALAGCELLVSTGNLSGGPIAGNPDGSPSSSGDASFLKDGANPDVAAEDAGALHYCASLTPAPTFCADFDDGDTTKLWSDTVRGRVGTIGIDNATATPSLVVNLPTGKATTEEDTTLSAVLDKKVGTTANDLTTLDFDILLETMETDPVVTLATMQFGDPNTPPGITYSVDLLASSTLTKFEEEVYISGGYQYPMQPVSPLLPVGRWVHVTMSVQFSNHTLTVALDHSPAPWQNTMNAAAVNGPLFFSIGGVYYSGATIGQTTLIHFDNVVIHTQ